MDEDRLRAAHFWRIAEGARHACHRSRGSHMNADLVLRNGPFTTLNVSKPDANAVAIANGVFTAVGRDNDVMPLAGPSTRVIDLKGRRALPGLIDNHLHIIRGGLNFNMELRWDGVHSLADPLGMLKRHVATP